MYSNKSSSIIDHQASMDYFFLPQLPTEVLEVIFLHLPIRELLQIRLTCHRYRVIVDDCPALRSQFCVKFPIDITLNRSFEPGPILPATRIIFEKLVISNVSAWWPQVGHRITNLTLRSCKFPLGMLRYTPNLKHLELKDVKLVDRNNNKFKLENLEKLKVSETHAGILDSLEKIVTKPLKKFTFLSEGFCFNRYNANTNIESDVEAQQKIINFISTRQEMLEEINIHPVKYTSEQLLQLRQCKLKKLIIERHNFESKAIYERNLLDFVRAQPTLEKLVMNEPVTVKVANEISQSLPNLKQLSVHTTNSEGFNMNLFFRTMNNLQILYLAGESQLDYVNDCQLPKLKEFILSVTKVKGDSLQRFLKHSTSLSQLSLVGCHFDNWSNFMSLLVQLKALKCLMIIFTGEFITSHDHFACEAKLGIERLRTMKIMDYGNLTFDELSTLLGMCPELRFLNLKGVVEPLQERLAQTVCRKLTKLETFYAVV